MSAAGAQDWPRLAPREAVAARSPTVAGLIDAMGTAGRSSPLGRAIVATVPAQVGLRPVVPTDAGDPATPGDWRGGAWSDAERTALAFAEQFALDVGVIGDDHRQAFGVAWGPEGFSLTQLMYVADLVPRTVAALARVFDTDASWSPPGAVEAPSDLWGTIEEYTRLVWNLDALDPVTTEVVRLHGARQHRCRLCMSLRSHRALDAGADDELFAAIDAPDRLEPRHAAARSLADSMIWTPARIDDATVAAVRRHLSPVEATEVALDVMRNATNKIAVALGADEALVTDGIDVYDIDGDGTMHHGLAAPTRSVTRGGSPSHHEE